MPPTAATFEKHFSHPSLVPLHNHILREDPALLGAEGFLAAT